MAIDAAVSLLQSAEIDVIFASVQLGELLDPINDAIERLSSVMLRAVGSLFLQRIVLEIASSPVFKWGFFAISLLAMLGMLLVAWERFCNLICEICGVSKTDLHRFSYVFIRIFIVAAIFRFIVPVFVATGFLVSQMFLDAVIKRTQGRFVVV